MKIVLVYNEAKRLKSFLGFFKEIDKDLVPENSILREFIGGRFFTNIKKFINEKY